MSETVVRLYMDLMIGLFAISLGALGLLTIADADLPSMVARNLVSLRLRRLRMNSMLALRHIDRRLYLNLTPLAELRRELSACSHCASHRQCDSRLGGESNTDPGFSYCPNKPYLDTLAARIRRQKEAAAGRA